MIVYAEFTTKSVFARKVELLLALLSSELFFHCLLVTLPVELCKEQGSWLDVLKLPRELITEICKIFMLNVEVSTEMCRS